MSLKEDIKKPGFWLIITIFLTIIFAIIFRITNIHTFYVLTIISLTYPIGFMALSIIFAWIVNPIRFLINKNKKE